MQLIISSSSVRGNGGRVEVGDAAYLQVFSKAAEASGTDVLRKAGVARVNRRLLRYYLIVRLLPNVFALACRS